MLSGPERPNFLSKRMKVSRSSRVTIQEQWNTSQTRCHVKKYDPVTDASVASRPTVHMAISSVCFFLVRAHDTLVRVAKLLRACTGL